MLLRNLRVAYAVPAQPHLVYQPPGGVLGHVLEDRARVATAWLRAQPSHVQLLDVLHERLRVARPERELGGQHHSVPELPAAEGAAPIDQVQLFGRQLRFRAGAVDDVDRPEHVRQAAAVRACVVDDGPSQRARNTARPLQPGVARSSEVACHSGEAGAGLHAKDETTLTVRLGARDRPRPVVDDDATDAAIAHQDVAARTEHEHRRLMLSASDHDASELLGIVRGDVHVSRPADTEGGVAGEWLI